MVTAIHVDDDIRSLELMKMAAADVTDLQLMESFLSGNSALQWLAKNSVDLIFLDVEMPEHNGLDLAQKMVGYAADVVFVTAHSGFAIRAFEACALDYLVKPIYPDKLRATLERYLLRRQKHAQKGTQQVKEQVNEVLNHYMPSDSYPQRIFVSMIGEIKVIRLDQVIYFTASGPYTKIFLTTGEVIISSESIKLYSHSLEQHPFFIRIHRSYLVNKDEITTVIRKTGNISIKMSNGDLLPIAQHRRSEIFQQIIK